MNRGVNLTVVVCSYNGASKLDECLSALMNQKVAVEVILVDDGSTDSTPTCAERYGVSVIRHSQNRGVSVARNTGLASAKNQIVAFCDDDCIAPANWTERILDAWVDNPTAAIIGGLVKVNSPISFTQRYHEYRNPLTPLEIELARSPNMWYRVVRQFLPPRLPESHSFPVYSVVGANMSLRKDCAVAVGGFSEDLIFGEGEDVALSESLRAQFGEQSVIVDPSILMAHRFDKSIIGSWRRSFVYGKGAAERWRKHRGWPSVPIVGPTAIFLTLAGTPISPIVGFAVGVAVLFTPWVRMATRRGIKRDAALLIFPFASLVDDVAGGLGFVFEMSRRRNEK